MYEMKERKEEMNKNLRNLLVLLVLIGGYIALNYDSIREEVAWRTFDAGVIPRVVDCDGGFWASFGFEQVISAGDYNQCPK